MNAFLKSCFGHAHAQIVREFADGTIFAWFPADAEAQEFTVPVAGQRGGHRAAVMGMAGMLTLPNDAITLNCLAADFPFPPAADVLFQLGAAISPAQDPPIPAADLPTYRILTVSSADILSHLHITAERHV